MEQVEYVSIERSRSRRSARIKQAASVLRNLKGMSVQQMVSQHLRETSCCSCSEVHRSTVALACWKLQIPPRMYPEISFGDLISGFGDSEAADGDGGWGQ